MLDGSLMLNWLNWVNCTIVDTIHSKGNKFVKGFKIKVTVDSKINDSSATHSSLIFFILY